MRALGVLGGMSWESTLVYYRELNRGVATRLGGLHSANLLLHSVDFAGVAAMQMEDRWSDAGELLARAARGLHAAGADGLLIASNTMHRIAPEVEEASGLPLLHIGDAICDALRAAGLTTIGLLGTRFTMEQGFLRDHLSRRHGVETLIPGESDRAWLQHLIYEDLCRGRIDPRSRSACLTLVDRLVDDGAQGVVLGCTELGLLLDPGSLPVPGFDSTLLHVQQALDWMLADVPRGDPR
jgi:aspartate racemase